MLAKEFALEKISFRAFPAERFTEEADDEHRAIDAVATPGKLRSLRVKVTITQTPSQKRAATIPIWQSRKRRYNPCVRWVTMVIDWESKLPSEWLQYRFVDCQNKKLVCPVREQIR